MRNALDAPAAALEQPDEIRAREPPQMRAVAMAPVGVAERSPQDEVADERPVTRVRHGDVQQRIRCCASAELAEHALGIDEVLQDVVTEHSVERTGETGQHVFDRPHDHGVVDLLGLGGRAFVDLDADQLVGAAAERPTDAPCPAADVEHTPEPVGQKRDELGPRLLVVGVRFLGHPLNDSSCLGVIVPRMWTDDLADELGDAYAGRTCLVTGADGFMGSHLTDGLVALGANVIAFVRATSSGALNNIGHLRDRVTVVFADLTDKTSVDHAVRDHLVPARDRPYVFHLGAQAHVGESWHRPYETVMANTVGTLNLLQSMVDHRVELEKFDTAGTSEEYGNVRESVAHHHDFDDAGSLILHERSPINPKSIYATAKVAADFLTMNYHDAYGIPGVVTRMFNNYGPRQNPRYVTGTIITQALSRPEVELGALEPLRDFCFCTDGVRGHLTVAAKGVAGDVYVYGQGKNISMADWSDLILTVGREHGYWDADRHVVIDERRLRPGVTDVMALRVGYEKLERETGWQPRVSWEEGVLRTIEWYAENRASWIGRVDWLKATRAAPA